MKSSSRAVRRALSACVLGAIALAPVALTGGGGGWPPERLRDTGLYSEWATKIVRPDHVAFSPQYPLWTDGAKKSRWMHLPAGTWIDASDPDAWVFPVGTRLWKEFRFTRRAETRFIEHTSEGWRYATYIWSDDEQEAALAPERGASSTLEIRSGLHYEIPSRMDCRACHEASPSRVLGVSALQLSPDRDPHALHAEPPGAGAVDLAGLVEAGLVRGLPSTLLEEPPRIAGVSQTARAALGYLHGNCSHCHAPGGELASLELSLRYPIGLRPGGTPPALLTSLGRPSRFRVPGFPEGAARLRAGDPDGSVLLARMASRHPVKQMPPLGTSLVDDEAVGLIRRWIEGDLARGR